MKKSTAISELEQDCQAGGDDYNDEIKRFGNNRGHRSKAKRKVHAKMAKASKKRNR